MKSLTNTKIIGYVHSACFSSVFLSFITVPIQHFSNSVYLAMFMCNWILDETEKPVMYQQARSTEISHGPAMPTTFGVMIEGSFDYTAENGRTKVLAFITACFSLWSVDNDQLPFSICNRHRLCKKFDWCNVLSDVCQTECEIPRSGVDEEILA